jgi:hypothetical protein
MIARLRQRNNPRPGISLRRCLASFAGGVILVVQGAAAASTPIVDIQESGRKIQLDGFLLEWNEATARTFSGDRRLIWNAVNTSEGFTGFFKSTTADSCRIDSIRLCGSREISCWTIRLANDAVKSSLSTSIAVARDTGSLYSAEFVLPWFALAKPGAKQYRVEMTAFAACGDSSKIVCVGDLVTAPAASFLTPKIKVQIAFIAVLLAAFAFLQFSVRKKTRRTAKPRR